jgi:hypothetical protein
MTRPRTGRTAAPQAPRPDRPGHKPTDQAGRSRWTWGPGSWPDTTARRAAGRRWTSQRGRQRARGPVRTVATRGRLSVRRPVTGRRRVAYVMLDVLLASAGGLSGPLPQPAPVPNLARHRREADQASRWRWLR